MCILGAPAETRGGVWARGWRHPNRSLFLGAVSSGILEYATEHNERLPHSAFRGQTPDEMYFGTGANVPDGLKEVGE